MKRFAQLFFSIIFLFSTTLPLFSCEPVIENTEPDPETIHVGDKLPFFSIKISQGDSLSTEDFLGKATALVFFHTMCGDCQRELPVVETLYQKYEKEVRFICISREQTDEEVAAYWEKHQLSIPYSAQTDRSIFSLFASSTIPRIYITDSTNTITAIFIEKADANELEEAIKQHCTKE